MSKPKTARNNKIMQAYLARTTIYCIAKKHRLSWTQTKRIIERLKKERHEQRAN